MPAVWPFPAHWASHLRLGPFPELSRIMLPEVIEDDHDLGPHLGPRSTREEHRSQQDNPPFWSWGTLLEAGIYRQRS